MPSYCDEPRRYHCLPGFHADIELSAAQPLPVGMGANGDNPSIVQVGKRTYFIPLNAQAKVAAAVFRIVEAFIVSVGLGQHTLADRIFDAHRRERKGNLLVKVAGRAGGIQAVKYLYNNGQDRSWLISRAFITAAKYGYLSTMEFLYDTKRVSTYAFDEAMMDAATYPWIKVETMAFLCSRRCASRAAVDSTFIASRNFTMLNIIYDTESVSSGAIIGAFEHAAGLIRHIRSSYNEDWVQIVKLLYKEECSSPKAIDKALVVAVGYRKTEVIELLRDDPRVSFNAICNAFARTTNPKSTGLLRSLYGKQWTTPDAMLRAFQKAAFCGQLEDAQVIVGIVLRSDSVSLKQEFLHGVKDEMCPGSVLQEKKYFDWLRICWLHRLNERSSMRTDN